MRLSTLNFRGELQKTIICTLVCCTAVQSCVKSLILVATESAYVTM